MISGNESTSLLSLKALFWCPCVGYPVCCCLDSGWMLLRFFSWISSCCLVILVWLYFLLLHDCFTVNRLGPSFLCYCALLLLSLFVFFEESFHHFVVWSWLHCSISLQMVLIGWSISLRESGKQQIIKDFLKEFDCCVIGLQETKIDGCTPTLFRSLSRG